ncbi:MAG TPA: hypothetical protein PLF90_07785 [bacterium]|nr:hypothetical protein [bacterium]
MKKISFSIQNTLKSSISVIEELVTEIEEVLKDDKMIFTKIERKITGEKNKELKKKIKEIKIILQEIKRDLGLKEEVIIDKAVINSRCAKIWEILNDMKGEKLKKYGNVSEDVKNYINSAVEKILKIVNEVVDL